MESLRDSRPSEFWDRLVLLLIAHPKEGWESEFEAITGREIERLCPPTEAERDA